VAESRVTQVSPIILSICYVARADQVADFNFPPETPFWDCTLVIQNPEDRAWQGPGLVALVERDDIEVFEVTSLDPAVARNRALILAKGDYLVFGDTSTNFNISGLESAIEILNANPFMDALATTNLLDSGQTVRNYSTLAGEVSDQEIEDISLSELVVRSSAARKFGAWIEQESGDKAGRNLARAIMAEGGKIGYSPLVLATLTQ